MARTKNPESKEMYLETVLKLAKDHVNVHSIEVAEELGFSKPSVSVAMKNLKEEGYLYIDDDNHIRLTETGLAYAEKVMERHDVLTKLLGIIGVPDTTAEDDACRIEHYISDTTFDAIKKFVAEHK